jgi:serine protease
MRKLLICAALAAAASFGALPLDTPAAQAVPAAAASARVIVKYRADSPLLRKLALSVAGRQTLQAAALGNRIGIALEAGRSISDRSHVVLAHGLTSKQLAARIAAESDIEYAVADERKHIVAAPNDPLYASGPPVGAASGGPLVGPWYLRPPAAATGVAGSTAPAAINAEQAWDVTTGSPSIVVAVLDTGVRFDHPDLQGGNVLAGYDMISPDSAGVFTSANDGDGRDADASDPGDFVTSSDSAALGCDPSNSSWHGTQTLGLIGAATHNSIGMASVGHGGVRMLPVRVLGKCGGYDSDIAAGILWAAGIDVPGVPHNANPARVINMSLGGVGACSQVYIDAIGQANAAGTVVVISAGNSGGNGVSNPANCPGAIGVTALRHVGDKVGYSDLGPEITISAPGGNCVNTTAGAPCLYPILTTTNKGTTTPIAGGAGATYSDSFDASLGTSFAAPLVAGTAALMLSAQPALTPAQVKAKLQATARAFPASGGSAGTPTCTSSSTSQDECYCPNPGVGVTTLCGAGMLDAHAAVSAAGVQANISLTTTTPSVGQAIALTSVSTVAPGRTIATWQWTLLKPGSTGATITSASNGPDVVVTATAAGSFLIQLTITDDAGATSTTTLSVSVTGTSMPTTTPPPSSGGGGGGGGGALDVGWLVLLLGAVAALAATRPRRAPLSAGARSSRRG